MPAGGPGEGCMSDALQVLLIDDDPTDGELLRIAVQQGAHPIELEHLVDSEAALHDLEERPELPDVILLDINMPRLNGHAFLERLRAQERLSWLPVVAYSSSRREADIQGMYEKHCSGYVVKPDDFHGLHTVLKGLATWWSETVRLPARG